MRLITGSNWQRIPSVKANPSGFSPLSKGLVSCSLFSSVRDAGGGLLLSVTHLLFLRGADGA